MTGTSKLQSHNATIKNIESRPATFHVVSSPHRELETENRGLLNRNKKVASLTFDVLTGIAAYCLLGKKSELRTFH